MAVRERLFTTLDGEVLCSGGGGGGGGDVGADLLDSRRLTPSAEIKSALFKPRTTRDEALKYNVVVRFTPNEAVRQTHGLPLILCVALAHAKHGPSPSLMFFMGVLTADLRRHQMAVGEERWEWDLSEQRQSWLRPPGPPPPSAWLREKLEKVGMHEILAL